MNTIQVRNDYLSYMIGLGTDDNFDYEFFKIANSPEESAEEFGYDPEKQAFPWDHLPSYSISQDENDYGGFEAPYLLGLWVSEALKVQYIHSYPYNKKMISKILEKPNYNEIKKGVISEIQRIYTETQNYLHTIFNEDEIQLVRVLNHREGKQYQSKEKINYNFISSFQTPNNIHTYPGRRIIHKENVPIKNVFAYTNLAKGDTTLGNLENEVLTFGLG